MKLRNKKTGEILSGLGSFIIQNPNHINCEAITKYDSLAELNDDWEDIPEETKGYFTPALIDNNIVALIVDKKTSREEAEKVVEKLKAWKRLKDFGCKFIIDDHFAVKFVGPDARKITSAEVQKSLSDSYKLLFGGEE